MRGNYLRVNTRHENCAELPGIYISTKEVTNKRARRNSKKRRRNDPEWRKKVNKERREYYVRQKDYFKLYYKRNKHDRANNLAYYAGKRILKLRLQIFKILGEQCVICGFWDYRALQIDHVNSDGAADRKRFKSTYRYLLHVLEELKSGSKDYQLLCCNCQWIKRYTKENKRMSLVIANECNKIAHLRKL